MIALNNQTVQDLEDTIKLVKNEIGLAMKTYGVSQTRENALILKAKQKTLLGLEQDLYRLKMGQLLENTNVKEITLKLSNQSIDILRKVSKLSFQSEAGILDKLIKQYLDSLAA